MTIVKSFTKVKTTNTIHSKIMGKVNTFVARLLTSALDIFDILQAFCAVFATHVTHSLGFFHMTQQNLEKIGDKAKQATHTMQFRVTLRRFNSCQAHMQIVILSKIAAAGDKLINRNT